jgi:hypothetical protein
MSGGGDSHGVGGMIVAVVVAVVGIIILCNILSTCSEQRPRNTVVITTQHPFPAGTDQYLCHIEDGTIVRDPIGTGWCYDQ